jgi:HTH-type transcriptional regulator, competence development regulator
MPESRDIRLGAELRRRREAKDVTLRAFAKQLGIKPTYLSRVETGLVPASEKIITKAAKLLGDDPNELFLYAGRFTQELSDIAGKHPKAFADLIHHLKRQPENAVLRLVREVRDGKW